MTDDLLLLCPYCFSLVEEHTVLCPVCGLDTTRDAKVEMTRAQYSAEPEVRCRHCGVPILKLAVVCHTCRRRQS